MHRACDWEYLSDRARDQALRAIQAEKPSAAAVHQELCLLYCGRIIAATFRPR